MDPTLLRAFLTLMTCVAAIAVLMWYLKRRSSRAKLGNTEVVMNVLARQQLTPKAHVCIVQIGDRTVVLGVTDSQVSFLGDCYTSAASQPSMQNPASHDLATSANTSMGPASSPSVPPTVKLSMEPLQPAYGPETRTENSPPDLSIGAYMRSLVGRNRRP